MRASGPVSRGCAFVLGLAVAVLTVSCPTACRADEAELVPQLELLRPFLGSWVGQFDASEERPEVLRSWVSILDGQAIHETRTVAELDFEAETIYFFDRVAQVISYVGITNNGYVTRGQIEFDGEMFVQTGEQIPPDSLVYSIRVTFRFETENTMVDRLFGLESGVWVAGHTIIYTRHAD